MKCKHHLIIRQREPNTTPTRVPVPRSSLCPIGQVFHLWLMFVDAQKRTNWTCGRDYWNPSLSRHRPTFEGGSFSLAHKAHLPFCTRSLFQIALLWFQILSRGRSEVFVPVYAAPLISTRFSHILSKENCLKFVENVI